MDEQYEAEYLEHENTYFWFIARNKLVKKIRQKLPSGRLLDIGCGSGQFLNTHTKNSFGVDISFHALKNGIQKGIGNLVCGDAMYLPFKNNSFDIIQALDILEHTSDDVLSLKNWAHLLKPRGNIIITVPAHQKLWSHHDILNKHFRRYSKNALSTLIEDNNLQICKSTYWNALLFLPNFLMRQIIFKKNIFQINSAINKLLTLLLQFENLLALSIGLPFGISLIFVAEKKC